MDYGTPEQIAGIAQQAADILGPEVSQIKDDLADKLSKSPADWEPWTAEEQAAARERMGSVGCNYDLLASVTLDEDAIVAIDFPFPSKQLIIVFDFPGGSSGSLKIYSGEKQISYFPSNTLLNSNARFSCIDIKIVNDKVLTFGLVGSNTSAGGNINSISSLFDWPQNTPFCGIKTGQALKSGSKILVYGVMA